MKTTIDNLLTVGETARILRVSPGRVRQFIYRGQIASILKGGIRLLDRRVVERFASVPRRPGRPSKKY